MAKYRYLVTNQFKKDVKLCAKRGKPMDALKSVIEQLMESGQLPSRYKPHKLAGQLKGLWECHIQPDWLLIWEQRDDELIMLMTRTGTHADVFD